MLEKFKVRAYRTCSMRAVEKTNWVFECAVSVFYSSLRMFIKS
jgi:hypothetical protein